MPFGYKVRNNEIEYNLDFSRIEFKIPKITDALGAYQALEYQFNEQSLQKFATHILLAKEKMDEGTAAIMAHESRISQIDDQDLESNTEKKDFRIKLGFALINVSAHKFLHFIDQIQEDYYSFVAKKIDFSEINWD